jgi:hypothetical protein
MKIYTDDRLTPYRTTRILNPLSSKADIDGLLAKYGIKKSAWEWDPENSKVALTFQINEVVNERTVKPVVRIEAPTIWDKGNRNRHEAINWAVSMRVMWWFIKSHLEMAYLLQSSKTTEFLPFIQINESGQTVKDVLVPRIEELKHLAALPEPKKDEDKIIDVQKNEVLES